MTRKRSDMTAPGVWGGHRLLWGPVNYLFIFTNMYTHIHTYIFVATLMENLNLMVNITD